MAKGKRSAYDATPLGARVSRTGRMDAVVARLRQAHACIAAGGTLVECVCDGTSDGWHTRLALQHACDGSSLVEWDGAHGRTQAERLALVDKVLGELGAKRKHGGGWTVTP